jgi:pterin-4a-carbinolamine dehydratase
MAAEDRTVLSPDQVDMELETLEGWRRDGAVLSRDFVFGNFRDITAFLNHLVRTITGQNHHPDFSLNTGTRTISVSVTTHSERAITRADMISAHELNAGIPGD